MDLTRKHKWKAGNDRKSDSNPVDISGTVAGERPDCLLLFGTVVSEILDYVSWEVKQITTQQAYMHLQIWDFNPHPPSLIHT